MTDALHKAEEKVEELIHEAAEGQSARTPWLILGSMQLLVITVVAVVLGIVFTVYLVA
ncbi:MAG: hypothetical protein ACRDNB_10380 [Gaiellaceae bacterium]